MTFIFFPKLIATAIFLLIVAIEVALDITAVRQNFANRQKQPQSLKSFKYVFYYLQISTFVIVLMSIHSKSEYLLQLYHNFTAIFIGLGISFFGVLMFIASRFYLGKNFSCCEDAYLPQTLVRQGIYRYIRHPIYTSNLIIILGSVVSSGSIFACLNFAILFYYYQRSAAIEESSLSAVFQDYDFYKKQTGKFLPRLF